MGQPTLLNVILTLFFIMDPIGHISSYLDLTKNLSPKRSKYIIFRDLLIALLVMLTFNYLGEFIFYFLDLSEPAVRLASGVILFLIAIKILFPIPNSLHLNLPEGEPFIIPLAIPWIAGPSLLATIMLYAHMETCKPLMLTAILVAWMAACIIFMFAPWLQKIFKKNGLLASERLFAMILVMIAIQRFMEGVLQFMLTRETSTQALTGF
jgi:multiple antibiotic resistance protein